MADKKQVAHPASHHLLKILKRYNMTGKELITFIQTYHLEDCQVEVQYRDDGGCYHGTDPDIIPLIVEADRNIQYVGRKNYKRLVL